MEDNTDREIKRPKHPPKSFTEEACIDAVRKVMMNEAYMRKSFGSFYAGRDYDSLEMKQAFMDGRASSPSLQDIIEVVEGMDTYIGGDYMQGGFIDQQHLLAKLKALQSDAETGNNQTEAGDE